MPETANQLEAIRQALEAGKGQEAADLLQEVKQRMSQLRPNHRAELYLLEGKLYKQQGEWDQAQEAFTQLYKSGFRRDEPYNQTQALQEMGELYFLQKRTAEGIDAYRQALRVLNSHMEGYHSKLSRNYLGQGNCFRQAGDSEMAIMYFQLAKTYASSDRNPALEAEAYMALAELYRSLDKLKEALRYTRYALTAFKQSGLDKQAQAAEALLQTLEG